MLQTANTAAFVSPLEDAQQQLCLPLQEVKQETGNEISKAKKKNKRTSNCILKRICLRADSGYRGVCGAGRRCLRELLTVLRALGLPATTAFIQVGPCLPRLCNWRDG
jgi:hypothetical protein